LFISFLVSVLSAWHARQNFALFEPPAFAALAERGKAIKATTKKNDRYCLLLIKSPVRFTISKP